MQYTIRAYNGTVIGSASWLKDATDRATEQAAFRGEVVSVVQAGRGNVASIDPLGRIDRPGPACPQCKGQGYMFYPPSGLFFSFPPPLEKRDCDVCGGTGYRG